jgi:hypothetical protein
MKDYKIHIAGEPRGQKQRCTRCHTLLTDARVFWPTGALVRSERHSGQLSVSAVEAMQYRNCGRKPKPENVSGLMRQRIREAEGRG